MDIVSADKAAQIEWLLKQCPKEDIDDLRGRAYDQPIGSYVVFDVSLLEDCLANPEAYDAGWRVQNRISISDERTREINEGKELTDAELDALKAALLDEQVDSDEGTFCAGFLVSADTGDAVFAAFTGPSEGQGGIQYDFAGLFNSRANAVEHFKQMGDIWLEY